MSSVATIVFGMVIGVLAYSLVVYPAVCIVWRWLRRRSTYRNLLGSNVFSSVTIVIPCHNEESVLAAKLDNALTLEYPSDRLTILVASDGSTDRTVDIALDYQKRDPRIQVLACTPNHGKAATINRAIEQITSDVVCLCDANVFFRPDALKHLVKQLGDSRVGAASGNVRLLNDASDFGRGESLYYRIERAVHTGESLIGSMMGVDGGMYVVRRQLMPKVSPDTILDDFVISMHVIRAGYRIVYVPEAIADENGTPTSKDEFRRRVRVSAGAAQVLKRRQWPPVTRPVELWQFISHKLLRWLTPFWLIALLIANACLWRQGTIYQITLVAQILFYLVAAVAAASIRVRRTRIGGIAFYFTMSQIAMAVGILKGLFRKQSGRWKRTARTALPEVPST